VLERAKQLDRLRPVLVVTRSMNIPCYLEAMQMGAIDYLEKPIVPGELLRFVRTQTQPRRSRTQGAVQSARPNL
jgi:DNA-binding NtrC family response regulator